MKDSCWFNPLTLEVMRGEVCTGAFDLLSSLQGRVLVVDGLAGQGEDPDLRHLAQHVFLVAAERQDLASLGRVLHHLPEVRGHGALKYYDAPLAER